MTILTVDFKNDISMKYPAFPTDCSFVELYTGGTFVRIETNQFDTSENVMKTLVEAMKTLDIKLLTVNEEYGDEYFIPLGYISLVIAENGDYVRLIDNLRVKGKEVLYYTESEFVEDPEDVLGSVLGFVGTFGELVSETSA